MAQENTSPPIFPVAARKVGIDTLAPIREEVAKCHLIFHHIALTGGESFATALLNSGLKYNHVHTNIRSEDEAKTVYADLAKRTESYDRPLFLKGHWVKGAEKRLNGPHAMFTIMRDPLERFIAEFFWVNRNRPEVAAFPWDLVPAMDVFVSQLEDAGHANMYCFEYATDLLDRPHLNVHISPLNMASRKAEDLFRISEEALRTKYFMVGVNEMFEESIFHMCNILLMSRAVLWTNTSANFAPNRGTRTKKFNRYELPVNLRKRIERLMAADIELYQTFRSRFELQFRQFDYGEEFKNYKRAAFGIGQS